MTSVDFKTETHNSRSVEDIQSELNEATNFLNQFAEEMVKAKKIIQKYKAYDQFKRESNPYGNYFNTKEMLEEMSNYCWNESISKVAFLNLDQKNKLIESQQKNNVGFSKESADFFKKIEQNKHFYFQESLSNFHNQLTNYRYYKGRKRVEKNAEKVERNIKFYKFSSFDDGYRDTYHDEAAEWFGDLENLLKFISGSEPDNSPSNFGERLKVALKIALKEERFRCYVTGNYFDLRVLKNGNAELIFKEIFHVMLNLFHRNIQKLSLKQYMLLRDLSHNGFIESNKYSEKFEFHRMDENEKPIFRFNFMPKVEGGDYNGFLKVGDKLIEIRIKDHNDDTVASENIMERTCDGSLYKGFVSFIKKKGKELEAKIKQEKEAQEFVEFEKEARKRRLKIVENASGQANDDKIVVVQDKPNPVIENARDQVIDELICETYQEIDKMTSNFEKIKDYATKLSENGKLSEGQQLLVKARQLKEQIIWNHKYIEKLKSSKSNKSVTKDKPISELIQPGTEQNHQENVIYLKTSEYQINDESSEIQIEVTEDGSIFVTGDTKPFKEDLKKFKLMWSRKLGKWYVPGSRKREYCEQTKKHLNDLKCLLESKGVLVTSYVANM